MKKGKAIASQIPPTQLMISGKFLGNRDILQNDLRERLSNKFDAMEQQVQAFKMGMTKLREVNENLMKDGIKRKAPDYATFAHVLSRLSIESAAGNDMIPNSVWRYLPFDVKVKIYDEFTKFYHSDHPHDDRPEDWNLLPLRGIPKKKVPASLEQ